MPEELKFLYQLSAWELILNNKSINSILAELIMDVIPKAMQSIREEMRKGRTERLTVSQYRLLAAVDRGLCHNKEIGELLGVSEAAISRMIDVLLQYGFVKKEISKTDRRIRYLSLTNDGKKFFNLIKTDAKTRLKTKLSVLSSEETETVIKGLEILQRNLPLLSE